MKKLHSLAFCALVTPVMLLGAGSALAQQSSDQNYDRNHQSSQREHGSTQSKYRDEAQSTADRRFSRDQSRTDSEDYMDSVPATGMQASDLMGAKVRTNADKNVGAVSDLILDKNGQVMAIVVGVGSYLGMGQKDVAIAWDRVTTPCASGEQELTIDLTREELRSAPGFKKQM